MIKTTLSICPKCGADRDTLREMLKEKPGSGNYFLARTIIYNCDSCSSAFACPFSDTINCGEQNCRYCEVRLDAMDKAVGDEH